MKKTKIFILSMLCVLMLPVVGAKTASTPTNIPASGKTLYANIDKKANGFDFDKIQFKNSSQTITGAKAMQKIYLAETYDKDGLKSEFTAYCLDASKKYPDYNVFDESGSGSTFRNLVKRALFNSNNVEWQTSFSNFYKNNPDYTKFTLIDSTDSIYDAGNQNYTIKSGGTKSEIVSAYESKKSSGNKSSFGSVEFSKVLFSNKDDIVLYQTETELKSGIDLGISGLNKIGDLYLGSELISSTYYTVSNGVIQFDSDFKDEYLNQGLTEKIEVTIGLEPKAAYNKSITVDLSLDSVEYAKYNTSELNKSNIGNYSKALWIIENSYPVLSLKDALSVAGANYDTLLSELKTLTGESTISEATAENYVYSTVQYAIWYVTGGKDANGNTIGNTLVGSNQLAKLFTYLIAGAGNGYVEPTVSLTINKPKKELYKETKENYIHGPYTVTSGFGKNVDVSLNIENENKDGILLVDANGTEITSGTVKPGEKFYIVITKESKVTSAKVSASVIGYTYDNSARLYSPTFSLFQNLLTGRKQIQQSAKDEVEVLVNAKTGVENIAILLVITMISFSIGYLVLGYKNNPVEL